MTNNQTNINIGRQEVPIQSEAFLYPNACRPKDSYCYAKWNKGKNAGNWKERILDSSKYKQWRQKNLIRFDFTCQEPERNQRGGKLHVHHKKPFSVLIREAHDCMPLLDWYETCIKYTPLWDVNNGIIYCEKHHKEKHKKLRSLKKKS